jgi:hypothetical protein
MKRQKAIHIWNDLWHAWPVLGELIPESGMAFEEMKQFLRDAERRMQAEK